MNELHETIARRVGVTPGQVAEVAEFTRDTTLDRVLGIIAKEALGVETFEVQGGDSIDFHELHILSLEKFGKMCAHAGLAIDCARSELHGKTEDHLQKLALLESLLPEHAGQLYRIAYVTVSVAAPGDPVETGN